MSEHGDAQAHKTNLENTLKELSQQILNQEKGLEELRSTQEETSLSQTTQAKIITTALDSVTSSEPFLPFPGSVLPALLALRKTHQTIEESRIYLNSQGSELEREKRQLEADQANLKDQLLLTDALNARIEDLRRELDSSADMQPEDSARVRLEELRNRKKSYDKETSKLMKTLNGFIGKNLASMLAAEELGGPVVGDMMDIDLEDLGAGFNAQGKLKKVKDGGVSQDKRQRRIDEIWGTGDAGARADEPDHEALAAGAEMKELTEGLLNNLMQSGGDKSASYLQLSRESAAARFLVRSKVAQFHPKDATRLMLIEFGRDLDD